MILRVSAIYVFMVFCFRSFCQRILWDFVPWFVLACQETDKAYVHFTWGPKNLSEFNNIDQNADIVIVGTYLQKSEFQEWISLWSGGYKVTRKTFAYGLVSEATACIPYITCEPYFQSRVDMVR